MKLVKTANLHNLVPETKPAVPRRQPGRRDVVDEDLGGAGAGRLVLVAESQTEWTSPARPLQQDLLKNKTLQDHIQHRPRVCFWLLIDKHGQVPAILS